MGVLGGDDIGIQNFEEKVEDKAGTEDGDWLELTLDSGAGGHCLPL